MAQSPVWISLLVSKKKGIVIDRRKILLEKPIKTLGEFEVPVKIYPEVIAAIKVVVAPEEGKEG